jgi:hypothetical protein
MDVTAVVDQIANLQILNQFLLSLFLLIPMVLVARTVVAGTRYSPILIIVIFGLTMGYVLVASGVSTPGLPQFSLIDLVSRTTIIALTVSFFVGGQELRKIIGNIKLDPDDMVVPSTEETVLGTGRTQLIFIIRSFFLLIGIEALYRLILGLSFSDLSRFYPLIAYLGLVGAVIMIDHKAKVANKRLYIKMGIAEVAAILGILLASYSTAAWIKPFIALPQIFFAMIISAGLGALLYRWRFGPTIRALLFAGIPVVLAANFMIGGSRINDAFAITGMNAVLAYGFFGQMFWMFGGIALLVLFGKTSHARNLAPGMAGALSHSGLTGACTAGDLGDSAAYRAPIMINVPFFGHIFVFSILAMSARQDSLMLWPSLLIVVAGIVLTLLSLRTMSRAMANDAAGSQRLDAVCVRLAALRRLWRIYPAQSGRHAIGLYGHGRFFRHLAFRAVRRDPGGHVRPRSFRPDPLYLFHAVFDPPPGLFHVRPGHGKGRHHAQNAGVFPCRFRIARSPLFHVCGVGWTTTVWVYNLSVIMTYEADA